MKIRLLVIAAALIACYIYGQGIAEKEVPAVVKNAFYKQYPKVKDPNWDKENKNYEASFEIKETDYSVLINPVGKTLETEVEIATQSLPSKIKKYIYRNYTVLQITEAAKITDNKGIVTYDAEVDSKDIIFDSTGKFIKETQE